MYLLFRLECFVYKKKKYATRFEGHEKCKHKAQCHSILACSCVLYIPFHPSMCTLEPL